MGGVRSCPFAGTEGGTGGRPRSGSSDTPRQIFGETFRDPCVDFGEPKEVTMDTRDASNVNAEYARLLARSDDYSAQIAKLMEDTKRIAKWDRWILPLSMACFAFNAIVLWIVWRR